MHPGEASLCTSGRYPTYTLENGLIVKSEESHSHTGVIVKLCFGPIGCCVTGTRPHGPGNAGLTACVHGWAAHARQHPRAPQGSLLSFARVETVSLAQPSAPRPLSSAGNSNTPTRWGQAAQVLPSRHRVRVATAQLVKLIVLSSNSLRRLNSFIAGLLNSAFGVLIQSFYVIIDRTPE